VVATQLVDLTWTEIDRPDEDPLWSPSNLIVDDEGFLIFGNVGARLATWRSADGASWTSAPLVGGFDTFPSFGAATADATVLIGGTSTDRCAHPFGWFLWRQVRGQQDWVAVPFQKDLFCAGGQAHIAASADTFVVAGTGTGEQPFAWRSADGAHWFDASNGLTFDAPPALLASTPDGFIEIGRGSITDVRVLGNTGWASVPGAPVLPAFGGEIAGLEPTVALTTDAGLFAFFQHEDPLQWSGWLRRPDGSWTEIGYDGLVRGFVQRGFTLRGMPYLAVFDGQVTHLVGSSDLKTWVEVPTPRLSSIGSVAVFGDRVLLFGDKDPVGKGPGNPGLYLADLPKS
jgi:hypothetical protein